MEVNHKYKFYVVRFLEKPYSDIEPQVCVPYIWMKLGGKSNRKPTVAYPSEYSSLTRESVRNNYPQEKSWRYYKVSLEYANDSFREADKYSKANNLIEQQTTKDKSTKTNENKTTTKRKTRNSNQSSSPVSATKKHHTKDPLLRNNRSDPVRLSIKRSVPVISTEEIFKKRPKIMERSEPINETPNESNEPPKSSNENKLISIDLDSLDEEEHDTPDITLSTVTNNTVGQTILESSATNERSLTSVSQLLTCKETLQTVITHSPNQKSQEVATEKNDKINTVDERPGCQNSSTNETVEHSTKSKRQHDKLSEHPLKDLRFRPFLNYAHPSIIKQIQTAQRAERRGMYLRGWSPVNTTNTLAQNPTYQPDCWIDQSQQHQPPASNTEPLHHNPQPQSQREVSCAKIKVLEDKLIVSNYSRGPSPSPQAPNISHNNQLLIANEPVQYHNQHQRKISVEKSTHTYEPLCPNITTSCTPLLNVPNALFCLRSVNGDYSQISGHVYSEQLSTVNEVYTYQEPCVQEIQDVTHQERPTHIIIEDLTEVNPADQSATHEEPPTQETLHSSTEADPIDQDTCAQTATHSEPPSPVVIDEPTEVNLTDESAHPRSATHQEPSSPIVIDESTEVNLSEHSDTCQSTNKKVPNTLVENLHNPVEITTIPVIAASALLTGKKRLLVSRKLRKLPKIMYEEEFSPNNENHSHEQVSLQNTDSAKSINMDYAKQNYQRSGKQMSPVSPDRAISEPCSPERRTGKSSKLSQMERSKYFADTEKELPSVPSTPHTNPPCSPERRTGKSSKLSQMERSKYLADTEKKSSSVRSTLNIKQPTIPGAQMILSLMNEQYNQGQCLPDYDDLSSQADYDDLSGQEISEEEEEEEGEEEVTVEVVTKDNPIEPPTCPKNTIKQPKANPNGFDPTFFMPQVKSIVERCLLNIFRHIVEKMQVTITENLFLNASREFNESAKQMINAVDRYFEIMKDDLVECVPQASPVKPEEKSERKKRNNTEVTSNTDDDDDDDDYHDDNSNNDSGADTKSKENDKESDDGYCEPPKKKRGAKRSFVLPPEYDRYNSRWTLRYQAIEPGVTELMPHSKVYISNLKLANCKRVAKDYKALGRMLLTEIFSQNALSVCSLTGAKANAFDVQASDIRPGLDKDARTILLTYVENYGRKQGWGPFDTHAVVNSLRSKIQEMRSKYGSRI